MAFTAGSVQVEVGANITNLVRGMATADATVRAFGSRISGVRTTLGQFSRGASSAGLSMVGLRGATLAASGGFLGGAGLLTALGLTVKQAANFQTALNTIQAVSGATGSQMLAVSAKAKQLGADLTLPATSATDAANAMTELVKGGLSVGQAMTAAKGVLQLSAAAQIDNATAAQITVRALNAFGLGAGQATRVADVLAATANASTGEVSDFALGLQQSAAVARQTGLTINQTAAALAELADQSIIGQDAGTSLRVMLQRLIPTSDKQAKLMKQLGISVFDQNGRFIGITKAIQAYHDGLSKLTPEARGFALNTIFGTDAVRAANVVLGGGAAKFEDYVRKTERQGAAAALAAAKMKGFNGALEAMKSAVQTLAVAFGTGLLPPLTSTVRRLSGDLANPATIDRVTRLGREVGQKLGGALTRLGTWFSTHWAGIQAGFSLAGSALKTAASAAADLAGALRQISSIAPGGALTVLAALLLGRKALGGGKGGGGIIPLLSPRTIGRFLRTPAGKALGVYGAANTVVKSRQKDLGFDFSNSAGGGDFSNAKPGTVLTMSDGRQVVIGKDGKAYPNTAVGRGLAGFGKATVAGRSFSAAVDVPLGTGLSGGRSAASGFGKGTVGIGALRSATKGKAKSGKGSEFTLLPAALELGLSTAELTKDTSDDLKALRKIESYLVDRIRSEKDINHKVEELQKLKDIRDQIAGLHGGGNLGSMGDLFQGPFLTGDNFQTAASFGYKPKAADLIRDLRGQISQTGRFVRDVRTIGRRGGPQGLVDALLAGGIADASEAAALAHAPAGVFKQYASLYREREKQLQMVQNMTVTSQNATISVANARINTGSVRSAPSDKFRIVNSA